MISLIQYDEFGKGMGFPSIKDSFQKERYEGQDKIIEYLKNGIVVGVTVSYPIDVITGNRVYMEMKFMNDGKYGWTSMLAYYVENYNLRLPKEFENYVLNK